MANIMEKPYRNYGNLLLTTIVMLFSLQLVTEFVEGIYLYGLLGTDIPPEIGLVALFLSAFALIAFPKNISPIIIKLFGSIGLAARVIEILLPTRGRMILSGIGVFGFLLFIPMILSTKRNLDQENALTNNIGLGVGLGLIIHITFRALHSGSDLSAYGGFGLISGVLAIAGLIILWRLPIKFAKDGIQDPGRKGKILGMTLGLFSAFTLLYFTIEAPNIIARWADISAFSVFATVLISWGFAGILWMSKYRPRKSHLTIIGGVFTLSLVLAILPHQIQFPLNNPGAYPLLAPDIRIWDILPVYLMLALSPVLWFLMVQYLESILAVRPSVRALGVAFGLSGLYLVILILSHVFTTVYDYIPVIGPYFRDKYWLVYLIPSLSAVITNLLPSESQTKRVIPPGIKSVWLITSLILIIVALGGYRIIEVSPPIAETRPENIKIFTYNIQQGYNDLGERNFDGQIALVQSMDPDILGLQESDTARIAGGNADVVSYFANRLNMYSYYGPPPVTGTFGIALLSKYPIQNPQTYYLYSEGEQVAVIEAIITLGDTDYQIYVTHLGNSGPIIQIEQMLKLMRGKENVIAMGDFNFRHYEQQYKITVAEYFDAYIHAEERIAPTTYGENGNLVFDAEERIDYVFLSPGTQVRSVKYLVENESDHPGLCVEIEIQD